MLPACPPCLSDQWAAVAAASAAVAAEPLSPPTSSPASARPGPTCFAKVLSHIRQQLLHVCELHPVRASDFILADELLQLSLIPDHAYVINDGDWLERDELHRDLFRAHGGCRSGSWLHLARPVLAQAREH